VGLSLEAEWKPPVHLLERVGSAAMVFAWMCALSVVMGVAGFLTTLFWPPGRSMAVPFVVNAAWLVVSSAGFTGAYLLLLMRPGRNVLRTRWRFGLFCFACVLLIMGSWTEAMISVQLSEVDGEIFRRGMPLMLMEAGLVVVTSLGRLVLEGYALAAMWTFARPGGLPGIKGCTIAALGLSMGVQGLNAAMAVWMYAGLVSRYRVSWEVVGQVMFQVTAFMNLLLMVYWAGVAVEAQRRRRRRA
jgi:hypothetical protein